MSALGWLLAVALWTAPASTPAPVQMARDEAFDPYLVEAPAPPGFDRVRAAEATRRHLEQLIAIDTTNEQGGTPASGLPDGNELAAARWFEAQLAGLDGVETHVLDAGPGRANFLARLRAVEASERPVLLLGHMDVVGVDRARWSSEPFEPTLRDGYLQGRGAIDCKGPLAAELTAFLMLAERRAQLRRDVILLATAAEEGGPPVGVDRVLAEHRELLGNPEFALNEGGRVRMDGGRIRSVNIQTTEKISYRVDVTAAGPSGHASVPLPDNALAALARAVARVHDWRPPARLTDTTRLYFERQAQVEPDPLLAAAMRSLGLHGQGADELQRATDLLGTRPEYSAVLRPGLALTQLTGGFRGNVIPSSGSAVFNLRTLPGDDVLALVAELNRVGAEPQVRFALAGDPQASPPASRTDTALYRAMEGAARAMVPDIVVIPFLSTGATDGAALRAAGIPTYGILPIPMELADELRMHGDDERAPVAGLGWAAEYVYRVLLEVAG